MPENQKPDKEELILELNFVPQWARKPPGANPYLHDDRASSGRDRRDRRDRGPRRDRDDRRGPPRSRRPREQGDRRERGHDRGPDRRPTRERGPRPPVEDVPVEVYFIPEKTRIGAVVRQIHSTGRAYPLRDLSALFLGKPQYHLVKLEVRRDHSGKDGFYFYQCKACNMVFLEKNEVITHALSQHLEEFYEREEIETDPPAGNFVCVGRCRLSKELLGPPNYHAFNERVKEMHETRYGYMSLEDYRNQIEMVRDEELIEQWKQETRKQTVYHVRQKEGEEAKQMTWSEVESDFHDRHAPRLVRECQRVVLSSEVTEHLPRGPLRRLIHDAWVREERYPKTLSLALRPAFRHMHLHLFRAGRGGTFVTAIRPHPIDKKHTITTIAEVLGYLSEHPGCTRHELAEGLRPEAPPDSTAVATVLNPLRWLIERGHVIEFFNGTLAVPSAGTQVWSAKERAPKQKKRKKRRKPKQKHEREAGKEEA